jgi:S1-C subfamily serine protease
MQDRQGSGNEPGHESAPSPLPDAASLPTTGDTEGRGLDAGGPAQQAAASAQAPAEQAAAPPEAPAEQASASEPAPAEQAPLPTEAQEPAPAAPGFAGAQEPAASGPGLAGSREPAAAAEDPGASWIPGLGSPPPAADSPGYGQPGHGQPGHGQPGHGQPGHGQPGYGQPGYAQPSYGQPGYGTPGYGTPGYGGYGAAPGAGQPGAGQPGAGQPGPGFATGPGAAGFGSPEQGGQPPAGYQPPPQGGGYPGQGFPAQGSSGFQPPGQPGPGYGPAGQAMPGLSTPGQDAPGQGTPGQPDQGGPGQQMPGQGAPGQGMPGQGMPGFGHPAPGQPGHGGPWGPPAWQGQPGGNAPTAPQASWASPPSEQGPWTVLPGGQGGQWGPPPGGGYGQPGGFEPPQRSRRAGRIMIYVMVAALAAALGAGGVLAFQHHPGQQTAQVGPGEIPQPQNPPANSNSNGGTNTSAINERAVAAKVEPGIVDITSFLRYTGQVFEGTGMILDKNGLVLTNNHVVNGSTRLRVTVVTTGKKYDAQIVGTDAADDVALLKLVNASGLKTVQVGNSDKVALGTPVVALGNAGGTGGLPTVTSGSITALHRSITASDAGSASSETLHDMLQTNAPIAEGDSGGPLANASGQVVGMDTAANTQSLGGAGTSQGFAIPINRALSIARDMAAGHASGSIRLGQPAFIGIAIASAKSSASNAGSPQQQWQQLKNVAQAGGGINSSTHCMAGNVGNPVPAKIAPASSGTLIAGVFCDAPASSAGLAAGDVITAVNGHAVSSPSSLTKVMAGFQPGNTVSMTWVDTAGHQHTGSLKLAAGPAK